MRAQHLTAPPRIAAAVVARFVRILRSLDLALDARAGLAEGFEHPDAAILRLGDVFGAQVLAEIENRSRFSDAAAVRNYAGIAWRDQPQPLAA